MFFQAQERKTSNRGRKRGKSMVATSTPEMKRLQEDEDQKKQRQAKKQRKEAEKSAKRQLQMQGDGDETSSDSEGGDVVFADSDDSPASSDGEQESHIQLGSVDFTKVEVGSFVLVEYKPEKQKNLVYYIGKVLSEIDSDDEFEVEFMRKSQKCQDKFIRLEKPDEASIHKNQIQAILPKPITHGTTKRTQAAFQFGVDFGRIDIR